MTLCHASGHPVTSRVIGVTISITPVSSDDHIILGFVISEALAASQNGKEQLETSITERMRSWMLREFKLYRMACMAVGRPLLVTILYRILSLSRGADTGGISERI